MISAITRNLITLLVLFFFVHTGFANYNPGDLYQKQREKVNSLLEERSQKLSYHKQAAHEKSGLLGLFKSKKDREKTIHILEEVLLMDNQILLETKTLIDLKESEHQQLDGLSEEYEVQANAYRNTISKLQEQNSRLKEDIEASRRINQKYLGAFLLSALVALGLLIFTISKGRHIKPVKWLKFDRLSNNISVVLCLWIKKYDSITINTHIKKTY